MKNIILLFYSFLFFSACVVEQKTSNVDPELPVITISSPSNFNQSSRSVTYRVTFYKAKEVQMVDTHIQVVKTGTADALMKINYISTTERDVEFRGISGSGSISFSISSGAALSKLSKPSKATSMSPEYYVTNSPAVVNVSSPSLSTTMNSNVSYSISFNNAATAPLTVNDIVLNKTGTANGTLAMSGTGLNTRTLTITNISGSGTLGITVNSGAALNIYNVPSNAVSSTNFTVDNSPPEITVDIPSPAALQSGTATYQVNYSDAQVILLDTSFLTLNKTGTANGTISSVTGSGTANRTVTITGISGDGYLSLSIAKDSAYDNNGILSKAYGPSPLLVVDNTPPGISIGSPSSSLTNTGPISFTVTYSGASSITLSPSDITLNKTGTADATVSVSGTGSLSRTVTLSSITGDGTLGISLAAGTAVDLASNSALASSASSTFTVDNTLPTISLSAPSISVTKNTNVTYTATFSGADTISLTSLKVSLNKTGTANGSFSISGSGTTRTITVSGVSGDGTIGLSIAAGAASDNAGNLSAITTSSTFAVDNTPPVISIGAPSPSTATTGPVSYTVTYNAATTVTLASGDVTLNKTGSANATVAISGTGTTTRTITLSSITGNGSLGVSLAANTAANIIGTQCGAQGPSTTFEVSNDPLFKYAWHLSNTGQTNFATNAGTSGFDLNVLGVWAQGYTGNGINILVSDTGIDSDHEDINSNFLTGTVSKDFINGTGPNYLYATAKPKYIGSTDQAHGTMVAGIISAVGSNSKGSLGVAYGAKMASANFLNSGFSFNELIAQISGSFHIINQSWGVSQCYDTAETTAYETQMNTDRKNYIKSAGNDFSLDLAAKCTRSSITRHGNSNYDGDNTNPYVVMVAALSATGVKSSYSSLGSNIWISGYGGEYGGTDPAIMTTDMIGCTEGTSPNINNNSFQPSNAENTACSYTSVMNGTSSAAPTISGVVALMLEANSSLTPRDVKHILASTARQNDPTDSANSNAYVTSPSGHNWEQGWITNGAGFKFNNKYGFGQVDALAAVNMAKTGYTLLTAEYQSGFTSSGVLSLSIPDDSSTGVTDVISFGTSKTIEAIQIKVSVTHANIGEIGIELTSPAGTKSIITQVNNSLDGITDLTSKQLLTNAFYGENSSGNWTIKLIDGASGNTGTLTGWELNVIGR